MKQLVSREILVLVMVLVGSGNNDNKIRVWARIDWVERLLHAIHQLFEPERYRKSDCEPCFFVHTSRKRQRLRQSQSSENTLCVGIREMPVLEKRKMKNCRGIEKGSVSEDCKDCFLNK